MQKADGAFLTISELANELNLPQHILRYWESRFPQLKPLQRSGNRRYYRPADVAIARHIHHLLNIEGFTVKGARKVLADGDAKPVPVETSANGGSVNLVVSDMSATPAASEPAHFLPRLEEIRTRLATALEA